MKFVVQDLCKHFADAIKDNRKVGLVSEGGKTADTNQSANRNYSPTWFTRHEWKACRLTCSWSKRSIKDGQLHGGSVSCHERWRFGRRTNLPALPKTVEGGGVPQAIEQNLGISQPPTKMERSQKNHLFASMWGLLQLEKLKIMHKNIHFALKHKIYMAALKAAWEEIRSLKRHAVNELDFQNF